MSAPSPSSESVARSETAEEALVVREVDVSCRLPLLVLFISAAVWLVVGSLFAIIAGIKFHKPSFLADYAWLTYGRVWPAYITCLLYGFCIQAGLGVGLWILCRLGRAPLAERGLVTIGAKLWNLGVTTGVIGILLGQGTGYENLEMPQYAALLAFLGYLMIGVWALISFHRRRHLPLFISHWFILAALFWFPWIYSTANLLLLTFPVRGVMQAAIAWWFSANLHVVWLGAIGLGAAFYFLPKLSKREVPSEYLALFTFWGLILFGSWTGIPNSAPLPAWMPALSTVGVVLTLVPLLTFALNIFPLLSWPAPDATSLRFISVGTVAFIAAALMNLPGAFAEASRYTSLTWFTTATNHLHTYGFFATIMFGAIYYILPQLIGYEFPAPKRIRMHFWLATIGTVLIVLPLAIGGLIQAARLNNPTVAFLDANRAALMGLRLSTMGDLLLFAGHLLFFGNLVGLVTRFYRGRAAAVLATLTAEVKPAGVAS